MNTSAHALPKQLFSTSHIRRLEGLIISETKTSGFDLMSRAGQAAFVALQKAWPKAKTIGVLCGSGNNAGDGYILAKQAHKAGYTVHLYCTEKTTLRGDAHLAAMNCQRDTGLKARQFTSAFPTADVWVDAIFGIGLNRPVNDHTKTAIATLNDQATPILSLDIPSGLEADTGSVLGAAVHATLTVTFIALKQGLFTGAAGDHVGSIVLADLDIPKQIYASVSSTATSIDYETCKNMLTPRKNDVHKKHFGHVLMVGGEHGFSGAIQMSAEAATRVGAGLVSIATRPEHAAMLSILRPELMAHGIFEQQALPTLIKKATVIGIGPGLGQSDWSKGLFVQVLQQPRPVIIDADGLNLLAARPCKDDQRILTPHPGEAARLLGISVQQLQADRFSAIRMMQDRYGGVIVLKGHGTLIIDEQKQIFVCNGGNPGMASAGMGDILTGIICGLVAQGLRLSEAAQLGVCLHAKAGDQATLLQGQRGLLASDLISYLQQFANP